MIRLVVVEGPDAGSDFTLEEEPVLIGRHKSCGIVLQDRTLSRRHCSIHYEAGHLLLTDLASANGTSLNVPENKIHRHRLEDGDEILIGTTRIRVEMEKGQVSKSHFADAPSPGQLSTAAFSSDPDAVTIVPSQQTAEEHNTQPTGTPLSQKLLPPTSQTPLPGTASPLTEEDTQIAPFPARPSITLRVIAGPEVGAVYTPPPGTQRFTVGRGQAADLRLQDKQVSKSHFVIECSPTGFVLADQNSRNGTYIDNTRVEQQPLHDGATIQVGSTQLTVTIVSPSFASQEAEGDTQIAPFPARPSITLRLIAGPEVGAVYTPPPGTQRFTVGRGQAADLRLQDKQVSKSHFVIECSPTGFVLADQNSRNGTYIDNTRVEQQPLHDGATIQVGSTQLTVTIDPPNLQERERTSVQEVEPPSELRFPPKWLSFSMVFFIIGSAYGLFQFDKVTFYTSRSVSAVHKDLEDSCATCHVPWEGPSAATCGTPGCHVGVLQASEHTQDECLDCHTEHRGLAFDIKGQDTVCWKCHEADFLKRSMGGLHENIAGATNVPPPNSLSSALHLPLPTSAEERQVWRQNTPQTKTGLKFSHTAHRREEKAPTVCESCHDPLPGKIINALGTMSAFPTHAECVGCHPEVGAVSPQRAQENEACLKCHTQRDGAITRVQRPISYVRFSHDPHADTPCVTCHFSIENEEGLRPDITFGSSVPVTDANLCGVP